MTGSSETYGLFWNEFLSEFHQHFPDWVLKHHSQPHWKWCSSSKPGVKYAASWSSFVFCGQPPQRKKYPHLKAEVFVEGTSKECNKEVFHALLSMKADIESVVGDSLLWNEKPEKVKSTIELWFPKQPIEISEEELWPEAKQWLLCAIGRMKNAFDPILNTLPI